MRLTGLCFASILLSASLYAETVVINAEDDWAPFSSMTRNKQGIEGLSPSLVSAAFHTQGIEVKFNPVPFARCLYEVERGKAVACFDTSITEENKNKYIWHKTPLFEEGLSIFALSDSKDKNLTVKDLEGKTVSITHGYSYPNVLMDNKKIIRDESPFDDTQLKKILLKRVQYGVINTIPGTLMINANRNYKGKIKIVGLVETSVFYLNFSKSHKDGQRMADIFEKGMQEIKANGTYKKIERDFKEKHGLNNQ
ncbi:amino acid ABC transporter substrate-binding protein [Iodobacter sp. HSC-16F04]|uniref:Amino acid ABC transporter substrate-binding protein n=1 Tax=Iodobacter violaceini TaxID=3044271 RepID=A0ABX0KM98_9NEIS|nr:transporter substrate-binding domain-containing protein [Iodobacter violacea]NHQ84737.1 amino acid ABC transporter substrate-binding protein [Iodobacter violacea]